MGLTIFVEMFLREKDKYGNISERLVKVHRRFRVIAIGIPVPVRCVDVVRDRLWCVSRCLIIFILFYSHFREILWILL